MGYSVAIDGPAGAGKSTVAREVAKRKNFLYVDTGAMYRVVALYFLRKGYRTDQLEQMRGEVSEVRVGLSYENDRQQIYLNGENVTDVLREEKVGNMASVVATLPEVREHLLQLQRAIASEENVVMDGRDIGTHVLPEADLKIFLTASIAVRARRRYQELEKKGECCKKEEIAKDIQKRDERDYNRKIAPLRQAQDAIYLDSSDLTKEQVIERILSYIRL